MHKLLQQAQEGRKETSHNSGDEGRVKAFRGEEPTERDYAVIALRFTEWPDARRLLFPRHVGAVSEAWDRYRPR